MIFLTVPTILVYQKYISVKLNLFQKLDISLIKNKIIFYNLQKIILAYHSQFWKPVRRSILLSSRSWNKVYFSKSSSFVYFLLVFTRRIIQSYRSCQNIKQLIISISSFIDCLILCISFLFYQLNHLEHTIISIF